MTQSYMKNLDFQKKFKNRDQNNLKNDDEYVKFKEEETNTKKMTTILKSLNSPRKRTAVGKSRTRALMQMGKSTGFV
jgi:hypothetical protein